MKHLGLLLLFAWPTLALAHKSSDAFLYLESSGTQISGRLDLALRDLDDALQLDADGDAQITWGEVRRARPAIEDYVRPRLQLGGGDCPLSLTTLEISEHSDGAYAALGLAATCAAEPETLRIRYELMFEFDAQHRGLLSLAQGGPPRTAVFAPDRREQDFDRSATASGPVFTQYFREGVWHVWTGWDHLLFLAALFLPAVLRREAGGWKAAPDLRSALWPTAALVTAFTIAHAITLTIAAMGVLSLPSRLVESLVAATVVFAGLNNLVPMVHRGLIGLAAVFGLIHGAAIAGALIELGLPAASRVIALLAFNLGVEAAQLALVAAVVPLAYLGRHSVLYRRAVLLPASAAITLIGLGWLIERAFDLKLMP
ncbi:MAG: HupE/UreJ family protein [Panacagrimonas sp.]